MAKARSARKPGTKRSNRIPDDPIALFTSARVAEVRAQHQLVNRTSRKSAAEKKASRVALEAFTKSVPGLAQLATEMKKRNVSVFSNVFKDTVFQKFPLGVIANAPHLPRVGNPRRWPTPFFQAIELAEGKLKGQLIGDQEHVFGEIPYNDDDRKLGSALWITTFIWDADASHQRSGSYFTNPLVEVSGMITGWTGVYNFILAADDKWCKCRLHLRQSVYQPAFGGLLMLGEATSTTSIIDEENNGRAVVANLPGLIRMPQVAFDIQNSALPVNFDLEVRFEVELEGDSGLWFSSDPNSAVGSVFVRPVSVEPIPM
jgi:hypothetical protein